MLGFPRHALSIYYLCYLCYLRLRGLRKNQRKKLIPQQQLQRRSRGDGILGHVLDIGELRILYLGDGTSNSYISIIITDTPVQFFFFNNKISFLKTCLSRLYLSARNSSSRIHLHGPARGYMDPKYYVIWGGWLFSISICIYTSRY